MANRIHALRTFPPAAEEAAKVPPPLEATAETEETGTAPDGPTPGDSARVAPGATAVSASPTDFETESPPPPAAAAASFTNAVSLPPYRESEVPEVRGGKLERGTYAACRPVPSALGSRANAPEKGGPSEGRERTLRECAWWTELPLCLMGAVEGYHAPLEPDVGSHSPVQSPRNSRS